MEKPEPWFCWECQGDGRCTVCGGNGEVVDEDKDILYSCVQCGGSGNCGNCTAHYIKALLEPDQ